MTTRKGAFQFLVLAFVAALGVGIGRVPVAHAAGLVSDCSQYDGGLGTPTLAQALAGNLAPLFQPGGLVQFVCGGTIVVDTANFIDLVWPMIPYGPTIIDGNGNAVTLSGRVLAPLGGGRAASINHRMCRIGLGLASAIP